MGQTHPSRVMPPELWANVFARGTPRDFQGLQRASRWTRALYWAHRTDYTTLSTHLWNCDSVTGLDLSDAEAITTDIADLGLCRLKELNLGDLGTDARLKDDIARLVSLRSLNVRASRITDAGIEYLTTLTRLNVLLLGQCRLMTDKSFPAMARLTNLKHLELGASPTHLLELDEGAGVKVDRDELPVLCAALGDVNIGCFAAFQRLETLDCGQFMALTPSAVQVLAGLRALKHFRCQQCQLFDDPALVAITRMQSLVEVHLFKIQFTESIAVLAQCSKVVSLDLNGSWVTDSDLLTLVKMPHLERFNVSECPKLTDAGIKGMYDAALPTRLKWVKHVACRRLSQFKFRDGACKEEKDGHVGWTPF